MLIDSTLQQQLREYLQLLESPITIYYSLNESSASHDMFSLLKEIKNFSSKITLEERILPREPSFTLGERITFAGVPTGYEFTSLILALLQTSGRPPKISEEAIQQIQSIQEPLNFTTYISLSCHNCPDVVQALNTMAALNPNIKHTMVDGALFKQEVEDKEIMAVPYVEKNGEFFHSGRATIEEILSQLGLRSQIQNTETLYDVLIVGGGPAGSSAAIYAARKGIKTALVAERFGGQVMDTLGIENLIGTLYTEGPKLVASLEEQVKTYDVDVFNLQKAKRIQQNTHFELELDSGATLKCKTLVLATGSRWRTLGVPGEVEFKNKGVAYCPHCDGPLFKGKHVAVIGGGNSGVEAAIDLAGIVEHVTLFEYSDTLKADQVLQDRLHSLSNTTVITQAQTKSITGKERVDGIVYTDRKTQEDHCINLEGVFVQIGLVPNTEWLDGVLKLSQNKEILVDKHGQTSTPGIFAAGDCTDSAYKQIVISMGSGATAALGAFDYLIRN